MITVFAGMDRCFTRFRQVPLFHPTTLLVRPACSIQSEFTFALQGLLRPQTFCHPLLFFAVWCSISASRRKRSLTSRSHWTPSWYSGKSRGPLWWPSRRSGTAPQSMQSWARRYNNNNVCDWVCVHTACHLTYRSHKTFEHLTFFSAGNRCTSEIFVYVFVYGPFYRIGAKSELETSWKKCVFSP